MGGQDHINLTHPNYLDRYAREKTVELIKFPAPDTTGLLGKFIFLFRQENICCWYSLEVLPMSAFNIVFMAQ